MGNWETLRLAHQLAKMPAQFAGRRGMEAVRAARANAGIRPVAGGVLAPGDPPPPPGSDGYYDYRGIVTWREVRHLDERSLGPGAFRLGTLIDIRRGGVMPVALPLDVLRRNAAVIGPPGSGKTAGVLVPWIHSALAGGGSVVAVDVKGDMYDDILAYAAQHPYGRLGVRAAKWDFTDPARSLSWDWLAETREDSEIDAAVVALLGREEKHTADPYFYNRDSMLLRGLLRILPTITRPGQHVSVRDLLTMLANQAQMNAVLARFPSAPGAADLAATLAGLSSTDYPRVISGVTTALGRLNSTAVEQVTQPSSFRLTDLYAAPSLLVVTAPLKGSDTARFLSSLFLNLLAQRLYRRFGHGGTQLFLVVDEAARVVDRFNFEEVLSIARSAGVCVCLAVQDVGQIKDENDRSAIFGNCATLLCLAGASPLSVKLMSDRLGSHPVTTLNVNRDPQKWGKGTAHSTTTAPVLPEREIMAPPFGPRCAIVHVKAAELGIPPKPMLVDMSL